MDRVASAIQSETVPGKGRNMSFLMGGLPVLISNDKCVRCLVKYNLHNNISFNWLIHFTALNYAG